MKLWRRVRDWYLTLRTRAAFAEQVCQHDGTEPMCASCANKAVGW